MDRTTPLSMGIAGYRHFFNCEPPSSKRERISLLEGLCKSVIVGEIARVKYLLKPKNRRDEDVSFETQCKALFYFCGSTTVLYHKYATIANRLCSNGHYPLIFTRQMCLFALDEIINSDLEVIEEFNMQSLQSWEALLKYILAVNNEVTKLTHNINISELGIEKFNPKIIALDELGIRIDPLYTPYRGFYLMKYLSEHEQLAVHFKEYIVDTHQCTFERYIREIAVMYFSNNIGGINNITNENTGEEIDITFYYSVKEESNVFFLSLSKTIPNEKTETLLTIKKNPFYKVSDEVFLLLDNSLLLDKCYSQFINDFWFDKVKGLKASNGKNLIPIDTYKGYIGKFFEKYVSSMFGKIFNSRKHYVYKSLDELIVKKAKGDVEFTDVFIRHNKNVFISEVKATGLYDTEKYAGELEELYKNNREEFFDGFGLKQIVDAVKELEEYVQQFDPGFPVGKVYKVYPALILNEKAMQTPLMAQIFNERFQELMPPHLGKKAIVFPLTIIHVSDLEQMNGEVCKNPNLFWELLAFNRRNPSFIPPFYSTLNKKKIESEYEDAIALLDSLKELD